MVTLDPLTSKYLFDPKVPPWAGIHALLSDKQLVGQVGCRTSVLSEKWVLSDKWVAGRVGVGRMGLHLHEAICRRSGLSDMWVVGQVTLLHKTEPKRTEKLLV